MKPLDLVRRFFLVSLRSMVSSRLDYYVGTASLFVLQASSLLFVYIAFSRRGSIAGYSRPQVLLFFGTAFAVQALAHVFCEGLWLLGPKYVVGGTLDYLICRPVSPLFQLVMAHLHSSGLVNLVFGACLVGYALRSANLPLWGLHAPLLAFYVIVGFLVHFSLVLLIASLSFRHGRVNSLLKAFASLQRFSAYPLDIFPALLVMAFTFVIPIAFTTYLPVLTFFEAARGDAAAAAASTARLTLFAACLLGLALIAWRRGVARYQSSQG